MPASVSIQEEGAGAPCLLGVGSLRGEPDLCPYGYPKGDR